MVSNYKIISNLFVSSIQQRVANKEVKTISILVDDIKDYFTAAKD